jgi:HSP20 family protein
LPIPKDVNTEKAEASFKKGVLTISLPKLEKEKQSQKKIKIKTD